MTDYAWNAFIGDPEEVAGVGVNPAIPTAVTTPGRVSCAGISGDDADGGGGGEGDGGTGGDGGDGDLPVLAEDVAGDWDADDAVTVPVVDGQPYHFGVNANYDGVTSVPNRAPLGPPLNSAYAEKGGLFTVAANPSIATRLNGHSFVRNWGSFLDGTPYLAGMGLIAIDGFTIIGVVRPPYGTATSIKFFNVANTSDDDSLLQGGVMDAISQIGAVKPGGLLGEPGEGSVSGGFITVHAGASYTGTYAPDAGPSNLLGTEPAGAFDIVAWRADPVLGKLQMIKNGFLCPNQFTYVGPFNFNRFYLSSHWPGTYVDWTKWLVYGRSLSNAELLASVRFLGTRYGIATA